MEKLRSAIDIRLRHLLTPLAELLSRLRITPNQITVLGFLISALAAVVLAYGQLVAAGVIFLIGSGLDLMDGLLARISRRTTRFGAFLDSTLDRMGEGLIFAALGYYFAVEGAPLLSGCVVLALLGSMLISYARARAEALGIACTVGFMTRAERVILLAVGLLFDLIAEVVVVMAVLTLLTAAHRMLHVYRQLGQQEQR